MSTFGQARGELILHLIKGAQNLHESREQFSHVVSGVAGIGKTLVQVEVGKRIPKLHDDICVVYLDVGALLESQVGINIQRELVPYCRQVSGKSKILLLLDDTERLFRCNNNVGADFISQITTLSKPKKVNIAIEIFGSSQVLPDLIERSMSMR